MKTSDFQTVDALQAKLESLRPLPAETLASLRDYYRVGLTWSSNALEGNTLDESETKVVVEDGFTVAGHPLREVYEAAGHAAAFDRLQELVRKSPIEAADVLRLHRLFYEKIDSDQAGVWRSVRIVVSGSSHRFPAPADVPALMDDFIRWWAETENTLHPVEFAARVHLKFIFIHPFTDGNGRVARLLMNLALLRAGWPIAPIPPVLRADYIQALSRAGRAPARFILFLRDRVRETQREILRLLGERP